MNHIQPSSFILCIIIFITSGFSYSQTEESKENTFPVTIPLDISAQRPVIELTINQDGPYKFIFDTGSSGNVIDEKLAEKLNLEIVGENQVGTPGSESITMAKEVFVPNIGFKGTSVLKNTQMTSLDLRSMLPVDGVLSANFFSEYLITLDYLNSKLMLNVGELNEYDKDVVSYVQSQRVINIYILIDGKKIETHLDSGNPGLFDIPYSKKDQFSFKTEPKEDGTINTPVASFKKWKATLDGKIKIGNIIYNNPDVQLVEGFKTANVGYQILKDLKTTIDQNNNLIKFERSISITENKMFTEPWEVENDFTGFYAKGERKIFIEDGEMYLRRGNAPKLKLVKLKDDEYEMVFYKPVNNELPIIRFERDENSKVRGLAFLFKDGREEFVEKDVE